MMVFVIHLTGEEGASWTQFKTRKEAAVFIRQKAFFEDSCMSNYMVIEGERLAIIGDVRLLGERKEGKNEQIDNDSNSDSPGS